MSDLDKEFRFHLILSFALIVFGIIALMAYENSTNRNVEIPKEVGTLLIRNFDNEEYSTVKILSGSDGLSININELLPLDGAIHKINCVTYYQYQITASYEGAMIEVSEYGSEYWRQVDYNTVLIVTVNELGKMVLLEVKKDILNLNPC